MNTILHLCADIGSDSRYYKDAGFNVIRIGKNIGVENYQPPKNVYGVIANPVCTEFSIATGFHKQGNHEKGLILVKHCQRIIAECNPVFWVIENPASGHLKDYLGKPRFIYEPWQFGSPWTKKTALWGNFNIPEIVYKKWEDVPKNEKLYIRPGRKKPGMAFLHYHAKNHIREFDCFNIEDDMSFRSLCSQNFAREFFRVNNPEVKKAISKIRGEK
jgi:hypothetical protein